MNAQLERLTGKPDVLRNIEERIQRRVPGRVQGLQIELRDACLVLRGRVVSFYAKQLVQEVAMEMTRLQVRANEIEVLQPRPFET